MSNAARVAAVALIAGMSITAGCHGQIGCGWSGVGGGYGPWGPGTGATIHALTVHDDGTGQSLFAAGSFTQMGIAAALNVARWDGSSWSPLGAGLLGQSVLALRGFDDGTGPALYAGGVFSGFMGIARWDGASWSSVGSGLGWQWPPPVLAESGYRTLCVFDDGVGPALYVGGAGFTLAGLPARLLRWDGATWSIVGGGIPTGAVHATAVFDDGSGPALFIGGSFTQVGSIPANGIARWDGSTWSALGSGVGGVVRALAVHDDGTGPALYVAGQFQTAGGSTADNIARWNGTGWSALGSGLHNPLQSGSVDVRTLAVFDDGTGATLYAGGDLSIASPIVSGTGSIDIGRWNGVQWAPVDLGMFAGSGWSTVRALVTRSGASGDVLYAGGHFERAGGALVNGIARWSCGNDILVGAEQLTGPSSPVRVTNQFLTPGREYYNVFSLDLCQPPTGSGSVAGICITTPANLQFVLSQLAQPLNTSLFHFTASSETMGWGPIAVPPAVFDVVCVDVTWGVLGQISSLSRFAVH